MPHRLRDAAAARAAAVRAPADRPQQRRCGEQPGTVAAARAAVTGVQLRDADSGGGMSFRGYASVTETGYEMYDAFGPYTEVVSAGAFDATLRRADLDVPLVLDHDSLRRIARTTNGTLALSMDDNGLLVRADALDPADADVAYIVPKLRAGLIDEMSFKFRITRGQWSPDYTEYRIDEVDLHRGDVAIVGYGANPHTAGASLRSGRDLRVASVLLDLALADSPRLTRATATPSRRLHATRPDDGRPPIRTVRKGTPG